MISSTPSYTRGRQVISVPSPPKRRLARVDAVLEIRKILPRGFGRLITGSRRVDRRFDELHLRNVTRTVRKDRPRSNTHDELRANDMLEQGILVTHDCLAVDTKTLRLAVHRDEQHSDAGIDENIAQTFEHPIPIE